MQVLGDRKCIPHFEAVVDQAGYEEGRRQQKQLGAGRGIVGSDVLLLEIETGHFAQQPTTQRPRTIILAGDSKDGLGHFLLISSNIERKSDAYESETQGGAGAPRSIAATDALAVLCKMFTILSQRNKKCTSLSNVGGRGGPSPDGLRRP